MNGDSFQPQEAEYWSQYDQIRLQKIKHQRTRMEHLYQIIRDYAFKIKQLKTQNEQLKITFKTDIKYENLYKAAAEEQSILQQKNKMMAEQLILYKQNCFRQQIIISQLKDLLKNNQIQLTLLESTTQQIYDPFVKHHNYQPPLKSFEEYLCLRAKYKELQRQYYQVMEKQFKNDKQNLRSTGYIYTNKTENSNQNNVKGLKKVKTHKNLSCNIIEYDEGYQKLKSKYQKIKGVKKELSKELKDKQEIIVKMKQNEEEYIELIEYLKDKKAKICLCHLKAYDQKIKFQKSFKKIENTTIK